MRSLKPSDVIAALVLGLAVAIPPGVLAEHLAAAPTAEAALSSGLWILKITLLMIAALTALSTRSPALLQSIERPLLSLPQEDGEHQLPREHYYVAGILLTALALRIVGLDQGLWYDEIHTLVEYVRQPLTGIITTFGSQNNHPLYSLAAHVSVVLFGESAWSLRLPATLFGVASIWLVYRFGTLITQRREALLAAALLSVSYHHVWFSQNARGYTALLVWTVLGTLLFVRLLSTTQGTWRLILCYGGVMALAAYTHLTAVLTVVLHAGVWFVLVLRRRSHSSPAAPWPALAGLVWATVLTLALYAVILPQVFTATITATHASTETAWRTPWWLLTEGVAGLANGLPGGWAGALGGMAIVGLGVWSYARRDPVVTSLMVLPGIVTIAAAISLSYNLWPRYLFFIAGFGILIVIRGGFLLAEILIHRSATIWATLGTAIVIGASALTVPRAWAPKQDFEGAARYVDEVLGSGDSVVLVDYVTQYVFTKYLRRSWIAVNSLESLETIEIDSDRTWLLYTFPVRLPVVYPGIWDRIKRSYHSAASFPGTVGGGTIHVMVSP